MSGQVAHAGEIAQSISFDQQTGVLKLSKVQFPTKPIKVRFIVKIPPKQEGSQLEEDCSPLIYRSAYASVKVQATEDAAKPKWADRGVPVYDGECVACFHFLISSPLSFSSFIDDTPNCVIFQKGVITSRGLSNEEDD